MALVGVVLAPGVSIFLAIKQQIAHRKGIAGIRINPPVHKVKMMCSLVNKQTTALLSLAMPAAKVVGAMSGIQYPGEIDRQRSSH